MYVPPLKSCESEESSRGVYEGIGDHFHVAKIEKKLKECILDRISCSGTQNRSLEAGWISDKYPAYTGKFHCLETERTPQPISQTPSCLVSPESYGRGECPCVDGVARFGELGSLCRVNVPFYPLSLYKYIVSSLSLSELLRFHSFLLRSGRAKAYFYIVRFPRIIFRY